MRQAQLTNVPLVGSVRYRDVLAAWAPFDIAVCRLLLVHQRDPVGTLRAVTRLMRPGGRIIAMEPLRDDCFPRFDPPVPAVERIKELDVAHIRHRGLPYDIAWDYSEVFRAAGLPLLEWRGHMLLHAGDTAFLESVGQAPAFTETRFARGEADD